MSPESFKKYIPVMVVTGVLILLNLFVVIWYVVPAGPEQWNEEVVPGKIVSVSETEIITRDPRGNTKAFVISPETKILTGKKLGTQALLTPGTLVLVEKDLSTTTAAVAKEIRVITDKRKEKSS